MRNSNHFFLPKTTFALSSSSKSCLLTEKLRAFKRAVKKRHEYQAIILWKNNFDLQKLFLGEKLTSSSITPTDQENLCKNILMVFAMNIRPVISDILKHETCWKRINNKQFIRLFLKMPQSLQTAIIHNLKTVLENQLLYFGKMIWAQLLQVHLNANKHSLEQISPLADDKNLKNQPTIVSFNREHCIGLFGNHKYKQTKQRKNPIKSLSTRNGYLI